MKFFVYNLKREGTEMVFYDMDGHPWVGSTFQVKRKDISIPLLTHKNQAVLTSLHWPFQ